MADTPDEKPPAPPKQAVQETEVGKSAWPSVLSALANDANQAAVSAAGSALGTAAFLGAKKISGKVRRDPPPEAGQSRGKHAAPPKAD